MSVHEVAEVKNFLRKNIGASKGQRKKGRGVVRDIIFSVFRALGESCSSERVMKVILGVAVVGKRGYNIAHNRLLL
jgi:hypothetical protein